MSTMEVPLPLTETTQAGPDSPHANGRVVAPHDHVLPIRSPDVVRLCLSDPQLPTESHNVFRQFCRLLGAVYHHEFLGRLRVLQELYAPLDPDSDAVTLHCSPHLDLDKDTNAFVRTIEPLLVKANYRKLDMDAIENAIEQPNELGLNYVPRLDLFDHLEIWVRGETKVLRQVRRARAAFRKVTVELDAYQRLLVMLRFKPGEHLGDLARHDRLYIRMFKNVPHVDMEMNLPEQGARMRMRAIDKAQIASPAAVSLPTLAWKLIAASWIWKSLSLGLFTLSLPVDIAGALIIGPITAGVNSFLGFQRAKQRHFLRMIRQLYYMTLANNGSVLTRLVDTAEDEEFKEAVLGYFTLLVNADDPQPWTKDRLDTTIEAYLCEKAKIEVDFDVSDSIGKLLALGLATRDENGALRAVDLMTARDLLDRRWDAYFTYTR